MVYKPCLWFSRSLNAHLRDFIGIPCLTHQNIYFLHVKEVTLALTLQEQFMYILYAY